MRLHTAYTPFFTHAAWDLTEKPQCSQACSQVPSLYLEANQDAQKTYWYHLDNYWLGVAWMVEAVSILPPGRVVLIEVAYFYVEAWWFSFFVMRTSATETKVIWLSVPAAYLAFAFWGILFLNSVCDLECEGGQVQIYKAVGYILYSPAFDRCSDLYRYFICDKGML